MQNLKGSQGILIVYCSFVAISSILVLCGIFLSPSEPGNALFVGLSLSRLIFALALLIISIFFVSITMKALKDAEWAEKSFELWFGGGRFGQTIAWLASISFGLSWIGYFLPSYRAETIINSWGRIRPAIVFILLASFASLAVIFIKRSKFSIQRIRVSKPVKFSLALFFVCLVILGMMLYSGFGIYALEDFWYGAGVPILTSQLIVAILAGVFFLWFEKKTERWPSRHADLVFFLLIYAITAILWAREPLQKSFFFIGPYAPNHTIYPFSDAASFDAASQFALIGQRITIFNGQFFERSLYISFLVYLHALFGQNYEYLAAVQAGIFAIFPALIYLIGRSLNTRAIGFASAVIATLRGINSIAASNMIDMANPKMLLTDFPTAIGIALIVLLTCEWLKKPAQKWHYALWIGGVIGLTMMLRTNALLLLLLIPLYAALRLWPERKKWLISCFLVILAIFAITLPWELRNQAIGGRMYGRIFDKIDNVLRERYRPPAQPDSYLPQKISSLSFKEIAALLALNQDIENGEISKICNSVVCFAPTHFLHNVVTSILILPTSPLLDDLRHTVKGNYPYWRPDWNGSFTVPSLFWFVLNIFLISLGVGVAWQHQRLSGLAPLAIFVFYNLSNALARTSGGRYIVPIDWIISIYFIIGILYIVKSAADFANLNLGPLFEIHNQEISRINSNNYSLFKIILILALLFGLGSLIPFSEKLYPQRYEDFDFTKALAERQQQIANTGLELKDIKEFLQKSSSQILVGRALYPRYYRMNQGEIHAYPYVVMGFPRLTFTLIGTQGEQGVVLPGDKPRYFPHGADIVVIGCKEQNYLDALVVIILDQKGSVYTRSPASDLQCPLKQPVCNNNHNCH